MKAIRTAVLRTAYRVGYQVLRVYWCVAHPEKRGVKFVLTRGGEVLLVRHTYGRRKGWEVPGGGVRRHEEPAEAVRREALEELGVDIADWRFLGDLFERIDGKRDQLWCFSSELGDREIVPEEAEIAEMGWFAPDALPPDAHRYVARILAL